MRRAIVVFLLAVCVFGAAALGGFYAASRLAPERLRAEAEARLSTLLKAPVRLGDVRVSLTEDLPWLHLEARDMRADPLPGGASLAIEQVSARVDPFLLMLGRLELRALQFGGIEFAMPEPGAEQAPPNAEEPLSRAVAALSKAADQLRARPCPIPPLDAERLSVSFTSAAAPRRVLELDTLTFRCARLSGDGNWEASGRGVLGAEASAPFELTLAVAEDEVEAKLALKSTQVGALLAAFEQAPDLVGELHGELSWRSAAGAAHELRAVVEGRGIAGTVATPDPKSSFTLDLRAPKISLALEASPRELRATELSVADGALAVSGTLALGLPFADASPLRAELTTREIGRPELERIAAQLPRGVRPDLERALERIVSGQIRSLELKLASSVAGAREIARGGLLARAGDLRVKLSLEEAELRIGEADQLRDVAGTLEFSGDTLEVHAVGASFRERRMPRLALKLSGLSHVRSLEDVRCERPPPVPPLAAIDDLRAWVESRRKPPYVPTWSALNLDIDRLSHPLLFCTLEDVTAEIQRADNGYDYTVESGTWATFGIEGNASYRKGRGKDGQPLRDGGSISVELALGERRAPAAPAPDPAVWAEGRFALDVSSMGRFLTKSYDGGFRVLGARVELLKTKLRLAPSGELEGKLVLELGGDGPIPFAVEAGSRGLELLDVWTTSQMPRPVMSGLLVGAATASGTLQLGKSPLVDVAGYASLHARKGEIYRDVPFLLALAMTDEKIDPFGKRDRFPYRAIDLEGPIENGWMTSRTLTLEGRSERMAASGKTHLAEPYELESVIGMYPIPTLDTIVAHIPIFNVLLLGEDQALAGFYFSVTGEWAKPKVQPLLAKSVASGPATLLLEGVPNFVFGSLKAIGRVLAPPPEEKKEEAEPAAGAAPAAEADLVQGAPS